MRYLRKERNGSPENMPSVKISASVLNSNLAELGKEAAKIAENGVEYVHYDVMDGEFVEIECGGLLGRCVQHELDHLDGKLFTDCVVRYED